jgi:hypothetical protein
MLIGVSLLRKELICDGPCSLRRLHVEHRIPAAPPRRQLTFASDDLAGMLLDTMTKACR